MPFKTPLEAAIAQLKGQGIVKSLADVGNDLKKSRGTVSNYASGKIPLSESFKTLFESKYNVKLTDFGEQSGEDITQKTAPPGVSADLKDDHIALQKKHIELIEKKVAESDELKRIEERILNFLADIKANLNTLSQAVQDLPRPAAQEDRPVVQTLPWGKKKGRNPSKDSPRNV